MTGLCHDELRRWYRSFNRRYFGNRLPKDMDVYYAPDDEAHGLATHDDSGSRSIKIDTMVAGTRYAQLVLLHEMNHHFTNDFSHGKRFQMGMIRLVVQGAMKNIW